jgi:hypothetical protein
LAAISGISCNLYALLLADMIYLLAYYSDDKGLI